MRIGPENDAPNANGDSSSEEESGNQERPAVLHEDDEIEFYRSIIGVPNAEVGNSKGKSLASGLDKGSPIDINRDEANPVWLDRMDDNNLYLKDYERELRRELAIEFGEGKKLVERR